ncbi:hypothetical protein [Paenibacillus borealis]|uniref:Uncharacterized protein n=1 Tax=Paenibacillus borealis TaxID=160799 RepID=A0A089MVR9_PAEBO|nr:hypothetical protein [Paenibacillus borealis]AIQ60524.1 hypothetical protein PBOR_28970 [Paenibacillus borealis]
MRKNVLYIGTPFFGYYKQIIAEFEEQGCSVDYYNDRPSESALTKGLIKIKRSLMNSLIQKYFDKIMAETQNKSYDIIFIVNCKVFTPIMIRKLKDSQKDARFILYMWDSLTLYPNSKDLIPLFDRAYSFDSDDCDNLEGLSFLPLFYGKTYENVGEEVVGKRLYDIVSVCTAHPNRYIILKELFPRLESNGVRIFSYMFLNKLQYFYNKACLSAFKGARSSEFKFIPLSEKENIEILKKSNTVFDIQHNQQSGLTMRTIETLGAKRKLITTNTNVKKYDFYNEKNILVVEEYDLNAIETFLKHEYEPIDEQIYEKYSLHSWLETIISGADSKGYFVVGL